MWLMSSTPLCNLSKFHESSSRRQSRKRNHVRFTGKPLIFSSSRTRSIFIPSPPLHSPNELVTHYSRERGTFRWKRSKQAPRERQQRRYERRPGSPERKSDRRSDRWKRTQEGDSRTIEDERRRRAGGSLREEDREEAEFLRPCLGAGCSRRCAGEVSRRSPIGRGGRRSMTWEELAAMPLVETVPGGGQPQSPLAEEAQARAGDPYTGGLIPST